MKTVEEIKHAFQPAGKLDPGQSQRALRLQNAAQMLAEEIIDLVPECADRSHALRLVLDAKFWGTQAITHFGQTIEAKGGPNGDKKEKNNK